MTRTNYDVAIVGGGPAGAVTAMYLLKEGLQPLIIEKADFPRYHIGESMTGECGGIMRELGFEQKLLDEGHAIKHGVTVYGTGGKNAFWVPVQERTPEGNLLPNWTWQVSRTKFDEMLLNEAVERGAHLLRGEATAPVVEDDGRVVGVGVRKPDGEVEEIGTKVLVDASGQGTFLASRGVTSRDERGRYDKQAAFFSQVTGAIRDPGENGGNTLIFYREKHHWGWFIPLDDEVTSVGVVVPSEYYQAQGLSREDFLRQELRTLNPELSRRVPDLTFGEDVRTASNYSYHVKNFTGPGYICVGDSHRFIDPIFSFGLFVGVKEGKFAAEAIARHLSGETTDSANPFSAYQATCDQGQDLLQDLIDCFWDYPLAFQYIVHYKYKDDIIDFFAGRIYDGKLVESEGFKAVKRLVAGKTA